MKNVVPFRAPAKFAEHGIDWTRAAQTETERRLREAFLTYETSCGPNGLVSILLLAIVAKLQGAAIVRAGEFERGLAARGPICTRRGRV